MTDSDVEGVGRRLAVEQLERGQRERRQRLVEGEVGLQVDGEPHRAALLVGRRRAARRRRRRAARGRWRWPGGCAGAARRRSSWLSVSRWRMAANASPGRAMTLSSIAWLTAKLRGQRLGLGGDQPVEGRLAPATRTPRAASCAPPCGASSGRRRPWPGPARSRPRARAPARRPCPRCRSRPGPARPAIWWNSRALRWRVRIPSYLRQAGEQHGADRHVDADAEGVGAADDLEQPGLGQLLDQPAVLRQHAGVVHADAVPDQPGQRPPEARR